MLEANVMEKQQKTDGAVSHLADKIATTTKLSNEQRESLRAGFIADPDEGLSAFDTVLVSLGVDVDALVAQIGQSVTENLNESHADPRRHILLLLAEKFNLLPFPTARGVIKAPPH